MDAFRKDPQEVLDFTRDWTDFLDGDTIATSSWEIEIGGDDLVIDADSNTTIAATVRLSAGAAGVTYVVTNTIVTAGGQTAQWSMEIVVRQTRDEISNPEPVLQVTHGLTRIPIFIVQDADWREPLPQIMDGAVPKDLTGARIDIRVRPAFDHTTSILFLSTTNGGITIVDEEEGIADVTADQATIEPLPPGEWTYLLRLIEVDGSTWELMRGPFTIYAGRD